MIQAPSEKLNQSLSHRGYFAEWNFAMAEHSESVLDLNQWRANLTMMKMKMTTKKNYPPASRPEKHRPEPTSLARPPQDCFRPGNLDTHRQPRKKLRPLPDPNHTPDTRQRHSAGSSLQHEDSRALSADSSTSQQLWDPLEKI
jgi:hypothetical protein